MLQKNYQSNIKVMINLNFPCRDNSPECSNCTVRNGKVWPKKLCQGQIILFIEEIGGDFQNFGLWF